MVTSTATKSWSPISLKQSVSILSFVCCMKIGTIIEYPVANLWLQILLNTWVRIGVGKAFGVRVRYEIILKFIFVYCQNLTI